MKSNLEKLKRLNKIHNINNLVSITLGTIGLSTSFVSLFLGLGSVSLCLLVSSAAFFGIGSLINNIVHDKASVLDLEIIENNKIITEDYTHSKQNEKKVIIDISTNQTNLDKTPKSIDEIQK